MFSFPASEIFTRCDFFPEEFSVLLTFKVGARAAAGKTDECLFALIPSGTAKVKVAVRLYRGRLQVDYMERLTGQRRVTEFKSVKVRLAATVVGFKATVGIGRRTTRRLGSCESRTFRSLMVVFKCKSLAEFDLHGKCYDCHRIGTTIHTVDWHILI